jgi:hypothetical protein
VGGFGSGRHGGAVTAEGTASYIIAISSLRSFLQKGQCLTGTISFNEGRFPIVITIDLKNEWNCFVELIHSTRDEREGDRIVTGRVQLVWTAPTYGGRPGGFCAREPAAAQPSFFCRMVAGISGATKPTASDMPASAKIDLVGFNEAPQN